MSRRALTTTTRSPPTTRPTRPTDEFDAPLVPDLGTRTGRTDQTTEQEPATRPTTTQQTTTDTPSTTDRAERRRRRDSLDIALMEDSE